MSGDTLEALIPIGIFVLIVGLLVGIVLVSFYFDKKRREAWQAMAETLGFAYTERDTSIPDTYSALKLFREGRGRRADNVLRGSHGGITALLLDYQYTTGSGKNSSTHVHTLCLVEDEDLYLPDLLLRKKVRFFDFLGELFGGQDVNFEEDPAFSESFVLQGSDEEAVRKLFSPAIRAHILEKREMPYHVMGLGHALMIAYTGRRAPKLAPEMLQEVFSLAALFKSA